MTQSLDGILKEELLNCSSMSRLSNVFCRNLVTIYPTCTDPAMILLCATALYYCATQKIESHSVNAELRGLSEPYAHQIISDFEWRIQCAAKRSPEFCSAYNKCRPDLKLSPEFEVIMPQQYVFHT